MANASFRVCTTSHAMVMDGSQVPDVAGVQLANGIDALDNFVLLSCCNNVVVLLRTSPAIERAPADRVLQHLPRVTQVRRVGLVQATV